MTTPTVSLEAPPANAPSPEAVEAFGGKLFQDFAGANSVVMAALGDRLGLFKVLATAGPATSAQLAARAGVDERYAREWLAAMASAGYLAYDARGEGIYTLRPEAAPFLADEGGPMFVGGALQQWPAGIQMLDKLARAFRDGEGVRVEEYPPDFFEGLERFTNAWHDHFLVQHWIPLAPEARAKLEAGARVADVGCGGGRALVRLAQAFPRSRFDGFDVHAPSLQRGEALARVAGVHERVRFHKADATKGIPGQYDLITLFDVLHDMPHPEATLRALRQSLAPDGRILALEINCKDRLEDNFGPLGTIWLAGSIVYCMSTSLGQHGEGLGTIGLPEARLREMAKRAGFSEVVRLPMEHPINALYELRA